MKKHEADMVAKDLGRGSVVIKSAKAGYYFVDVRLESGETVRLFDDSWLIHYGDFDLRGFKRMTRGGE